MTAVARIATDRVPDVVLVPAEAIFQQDGAPVVYRLDGSEFVETRVEVKRRGKEQAILGLGRRAGRPHRDPAAAGRDDQEGRLKRRMMFASIVIAHRRGRRGRDHRRRAEAARARRRVRRPRGCARAR